jgi:hypothetical protein
MGYFHGLENSTLSLIFEVLHTLFDQSNFTVVIIRGHQFLDENRG